MSLTFVLLQAFTVTFFVLGLAMLSQKELFLNLVMSIKKDSPVLLLGGTFNLFVGTALLLMHHAFRTPQEIFVTTLLWLMVLKGVVSVLAPQFQVMLIKNFRNKDWMPLWGIMIIGLSFVFGYFGFFLA